MKSEFQAAQSSHESELEAITLQSNRLLEQALARIEEVHLNLATEQHKYTSLSGEIQDKIKSAVAENEYTLSSYHAQQLAEYEQRINALIKKLEVTEKDKAELKH